MQRDKISIGIVSWKQLEGRAINPEILSAELEHEQTLLIL